MMTFGFSQLNLAVSGISGTLCLANVWLHDQKGPDLSQRRRLETDLAPPDARCISWGFKVCCLGPNTSCSVLPISTKSTTIAWFRTRKSGKFMDGHPPYEKSETHWAISKWLKCKYCNMLIYINICPSLVAWTILKRHKTCPFWCEIPISTHTQPPDGSRPRGIDTNLHTIGASCFGFHLLQWKALENLANCGFLMDIWCVHYINCIYYIYYNYIYILYVYILYIYIYYILILIIIVIIFILYLKKYITNIVI